MLDKKFLTQGLEHFDFKKTAWYKKIVSESREYKYNVLLFTLLGCLLFPLYLVSLRLLAGRDVSLALQLVIAASLIAALAVLVRTRRVRVMGYAVLVVPVVGLFLAMYRPGGSFVYLIVLAVYPLLAIQLRGARKGSLWWSSLVAVFLACYIAQLSGLIPRWVVNLRAIDILPLITSTTMIYLFAYSSERRHEKMVGRLTDMLVFDETTGIPCRDVLTHSIEADKNYLFAIIKIENFSDLVALFGYEFSDTITQFASQKLIKYQKQFRYQTYQLKYNEYGILLETPGPVGPADAEQQLCSVIKALEIESIPWERDRIRLIYRVGGTMITPGDQRNPLSKADIALKKAERGHTVITIFDGDTNEKASAYDSAVKFNELISNRENNSFKTVFQPIFSRNGTDIAWYEALLRLKREDGEYVSIYPYLEVAKSTGLYQNLTDFVLARSAEAILEYDVDVSVNISIQDIVRPDFIQLVDQAWQQIKHKSGRIIFEILESDELVEVDKCLWFIDYIANYGFRIAIDDFGTGYSNYCTLVNLPIDIVKIDGSLIRKIRYDENARTLVEGIVHFCEKSNKKTVAEYVEDEQLYDSLRAMRIDFMQGYYFAPPAPIASSPLPGGPATECDGAVPDCALSAVEAASAAGQL